MKMRRFALKALIASGILAGTFAAAHADRTLRLSVQVGTNHPVGANTVLFKNEVERISDGAIRVEIYDNAQLFKGSEVPQAVSSGAIDMGVVLSDEYAGTIPAAGIFNVAFMFPTYEVLARAAEPDSEVRGIFDELIRGTGTRVLWWQDYGPVQLMSNGAPILSPDDMRGKLVRALGKTSGDFIEAAGGVPVVVGGSEQFVAYQRGTVDIGMSGTTAIKSRSLYEVMDQVTITNHALAEFIVVINDALWDGLSDQEREWISQAAATAEQTMREETEAENLEAEEWLRENTRMTITHLTPEQIKVWQDAAAPATETFIREAGEIGQRLVDAVRALY